MPLTSRIFTISNGFFRLGKSGCQSHPPPKFCVGLLRAAQLALSAAGASLEPRQRRVVQRVGRAHHGKARVPRLLPGAQGRAAAEEAAHPLRAVDLAPTPPHDDARGRRSEQSRRFGLLSMRFASMQGFSERLKYGNLQVTRGRTAEEFSKFELFSMTKCKVTPG